MKNIKHLSAHNFYLVVTICWTCLIFYLCLTESSSLPNFQIPLKDKFVHALFYFVFVLVSYKSLYKKNQNSKSIAFIGLLSLCIGIFIEVLQDKITISRAFDLFDIVANFFGTLFSIVLICFKKYITPKKSCM